MERRESGYPAQSASEYAVRGEVMEPAPRWSPEESALYVALDALDQREMRLAGIMHEEAHLLNSIRQVWV